MSSTQRDVLVLLRQVENRLCADCDAPLGETSVSGSCTFGTWICEQCSSVHSSLNGFRLKSVSDNWSEKELNIMRASVSNQRVNKTYEKYVPQGWTKCRPDATYEDREIWIRAKYECKVFVLPNRRRIESQTIKPTIASLPARLVDFFLVISPALNLQTPKTIIDSRPEDVFFEPWISSCYPAPDFYKDMLLPEHVNHFVFPNGVHLTSVEKTPYFFTFVLTDVSGIKMYGATLHVYELVEPDELAAMVGHPVGSPQFPKWPLVFAPKALTVLSHYAFYNLFREFLEQLYRISLSTSPIPLERYIVNFVHEIPLPPQGQVEVNLALADRTLCISRPPKNRLPMVDFSYRPLFTCLSVDNILLIFSALCTERKVCICSENIALLTPVQEALLSLLFPLVWQGAYIPVVPDSIPDILDAPVPILVGMHARFLRDAEEVLRHPGVIYVDLEAGTVSMAKDESGKDFPPPPPLPQRAESKLRSKLLQFGGCVHKKIAIYTAAGDAFPRREHLIPIRIFASEQGVIVRSTSVRKSKLASSTETSILLTHPTVCSRTMVRSSDSNVGSILDPANNLGSGKDVFNAAEIRGAFLRFFVSLLQDYGRHLGVDRSAHSTTSRQSIVQNKTSALLAGLRETQMFERFSEECIERPYQPEIKLFDEAILEKLNRHRSMTLMAGSRNSLPFLSDTSDDVSEVYTPPPPSSWGVPVDHTFYYVKFPVLHPDHYGPVRRARPLLRTVEVQRARRVISEELLQLSRVRRASFADRDTRLRVEELLADAKQQFHRVNIAIVAVQSRVRMRSVRLAFLRYRRVSIRLQRKWRAVRLRRLNAQYDAREKALVCLIQAWIRGHLARVHTKIRRRRLLQLQSFMRMYVCVVRLRRVRIAALCVQAVYRGWVVRRRYLACLRAVSRTQAWVRGWLERVRGRRARQARIALLRVQIFELWATSHTSLRYRSQFWRLIDGCGYLHVGLHEDELRRLWTALNLTSLFVSCKTFGQRFHLVKAWLKAEGKVIGSSRTTATATAAVEEGVLEEREALYKRLKVADKRFLESVFNNFGLSGSTMKKRKHTVASIVWRHWEQAAASAEITAVGDGTAWLQRRRRACVERAVVSTVEACLVSVQRCRARRVAKRRTRPSQLFLLTDFVVDERSRHSSSCSSPIAVAREKRASTNFSDVS